MTITELLSCCWLCCYHTQSLINWSGLFRSQSLYSGDYDSFLLCHIYYSRDLTGSIYKCWEKGKRLLVKAGEKLDPFYPIDFATAGYKRRWPIKISSAWPQENNWQYLYPGKCAVQVPSLTPHKLLTQLDVFLFLSKLISAPNTCCQRKKNRKTKRKSSSQNKFYFFPWVFLTFSGSQEISTWYKFPFHPSHVVLLSRYTSCPILTTHFIHDTFTGKLGVQDLSWLYKYRRIS